MTKDIGEKSNVQSAYPETVERLSRLLEKYVSEGTARQACAEERCPGRDLQEGKAKAEHD